MNAIHKELAELLNSIDFEEDGSISITQTVWNIDQLKIELTIQNGIDTGTQIWQVQINGLKASMINSRFAYDLKLENDHPLLWAYDQPQTSLYFGKACSSPYELLAQIYVTHTQQAGYWIPFEKHIFNSQLFIAHCHSNIGLFAEGPLKLLEAYKKVLVQNEMKPTLVGSHLPDKPNDQDLQVLLIGDSYVVGEVFEFNRI